MKRAAVVAAAAALLGGCAAKSVYLPVDHAGPSTRGGPPVARYPIPRDRPEGAVEVAAVAEGRRSGARVVSVRVVFDNRSGDAWSFDLAAQRLVVDESPTRRESFAEESGRLLVPPRTALPVELHFLVAGETPPTGFRFEWEVATPLALVRNGSAFRRAEAYPHGPPISTSGYYYRPFFDYQPALPVQTRVGFEGPRRAAASPPQRRRTDAVVVPAQPPIEEAPANKQLPIDSR